MKYGFILIELLIATLIASMIGIILMSALYQSNRFQQTIDNAIDLYSRAMLVHNQIEHDVMGAFVPIEAEQQKEGKKAIAKSKESEGKKNKEKEEEKIERKKIKPIKQIFYSANRDGRLETLTFITNNPMAVYWGKRTGKAKPKVARVVYSIKPDMEHKNSFILYRQEGSNLDIASYKATNPKSPRSYEVIDGIKNIEVEYIAIIEKEPKKKNEKKEREFRTIKEWRSEQEKEEELPRIPQFMNMKLVLWNGHYTRDVEFNYTFEIPVELKEPPKKEKEKDQKKKKPGKKMAKKKTNKPKIRVATNTT